MAARKTSLIWYYIAKAVFWVAGWKLGRVADPTIKKSMMIAAPHTSNWDLIFARGAFYLMDLDVRFTVKKEWTDHWLLGGLVQAVGGLAVDRNKNNSLVDGMVQLFNERDELVILITPKAPANTSRVGAKAITTPRWKLGCPFSWATSTTKTK